MKELMIMLAEIMPEKMLIEKIKELSTNYLMTGKEDIRNELSRYCSLLMTKEVQRKMSTSEMIKDMNEIDRIRERLNSEKQ